LTLNVVGVVCALASEARHLGLVDGTLVRVSGMGMAAATRCARSLVDEGATALVSWGMAGGLDPRLAPGTIFLPETVISAATGSKPVATSVPWRERLASSVATHHPVTRGQLLTTARAVGSLMAKATLFRGTGAVAVDMESAAVGEVAQSHQLPFIAVRVIVDAAADALPRAVTAAADSEGHLQIWRLLGALARTPGELGPLLRLAGRYRAANRSLAAVARVGVA
jgi:adenosylhomocysteine nucleosidase